MVEKWQKQLLKLDKDWKIKLIIKDIVNDNLKKYEVKKLSWYKNTFRVRKWKFRIIFKKESWKNILLKIESRWDVYKWL